MGTPFYMCPELMRKQQYSNKVDILVLSRYCVYLFQRPRAHVPLDGPPVPGPPSGASLGGLIVGHIGWGGPSMGPNLLFIAVVSPCRCEPLRVGCCGGEGVLGVS